MKATELRIGNIIHDNDKNCPFRGEHDTIVSHEIIYHIACNDKHTYEPIPLTEEWLVNFGFKYLPNRKIYINNFYVCTFRNCDELHFEYLNIYIKYVHQLQNLYHTLTGEELTLKS